MWERCLQHRERRRRRCLVRHVVTTLSSIETRQHSRHLGPTVGYGLGKDPLGLEDCKELGRGRATLADNLDVARLYLHVGNAPVAVNGVEVLLPKPKDIVGLAATPIGFKAPAGADLIGYDLDVRRHLREERPRMNREVGPGINLMPLGSGNQLAHSNGHPQRQGVQPAVPTVFGGLDARERRRDRYQPKLHLWVHAEGAVPIPDQRATRDKPPLAVANHRDLAGAESPLNAIEHRDELS